LTPSARFAIAPPAAARVPHDLRGLIATLPQRRPDIVALRMGYAASQASVRAAILTQFPPFSFGIAGGSDTSKVVSAGPQITMNLPIFHGAGPQISLQRATRAEMRKQYRARLDTAVGEALGLKARFDLNARLVPEARRDADLAGKTLAFAEKAYNVQEIDQRTLVDFATAATQRKLDLISSQRALYDTALGLSTALGVDLPVVALSQPIGVTKP
ncbi:MAG: TolC family protein, partial [Allgaiera sp.]|nr:TolC family protein [Allgaiera sp.]